jgi:N-acetylglucosaminylphosphatidylinositol deacetylase
MFARLLAVLVPILLAFVLRSSFEHDNVFLTHNLQSEGSPARVLLVTAHPDDESLFFAPTVISLLSHKPNGDLDKDALSAEVYLLCLSTGNADGLGQTRQQEMVRALNVLGIEKGKRWIVDSPCVRSSGSIVLY